MGFLGRIIKPLVENAFDRIQSEAMQERLKEQDKKLAKVQSLFPIQDIFNIGPMASLGIAFNTGPQVARTELENVLGAAFAPLSRDIAAFTGGVRNLFEPFYFENRLGGLIGGGIGQAAGFIAGFILPGGPLLWSQLFGVVGTHLGTLIQGGLFGPYEHPDVPGLPNWLQGGSTSTTPDGAYIPHDMPSLTPPSRVQTEFPLTRTDPLIIMFENRLGGYFM